MPPSRQKSKHGYTKMFTNGANMLMIEKKELLTYPDVSDISCSSSNSNDESDQMKAKLPEPVKRTSRNAFSMRLKTNPFGLTDTLIG